MAEDADIQLSEELGMYVDRLRAAYPSMEEIWLIGERAKAASARGVCWQLLIFAAPETLQALRQDQGRWRRSDVEVLVVTDGQSFSSAWAPAETGNLGAWGWQRVEPHSATYRTAEGAERERAVRVR